MNSILQISANGLSVEKCLDKSAEFIEIPEKVMWIDKYAFSDCRNLKKIIFPHSLSRIGDFAFARCGKLESLDFSNTELFYIETAAFEHCSNLKSVSFPETISSIGNVAFFNCIKLTDINLPLKSIGISRNAFEGCSILDFSHPALNITNGLNIKDNCVVGITNAQTTLDVKVPDGVDTIQNGALIDDSITEINIGDGIKIIRPESILCESLLLLKLPSSLEKISKNVFGEELNPPVIENFSNVQMHFKGTTVLKHNEDIKLSVRDGKFVIASSKSKNEILLVYAFPDYFNNQIEIPNYVTDIHYNALRNCEDHYVTLPDGFVLDANPEYSNDEQECIYDGTKKFLLPSGAQIDSYFKAEKNLLEKVKKIIIETIGISSEKISTSSKFVDDFGCDSLDIVKLIMALEEEFGCEISDEEAKKILSVDDVVKFIEGQL